MVGFGTFTPRPERAPELGRNPRTGAVVPIPASKGVRFATGSTFKSALNPKEGVSMAVKKAAKKAVRKAPARKTQLRKTTREAPRPGRLRPVRPWPGRLLRSARRRRPRPARRRPESARSRGLRPARPRRGRPPPSGRPRSGQARGRLRPARLRHGRPLPASAPPRRLQPGEDRGTKTAKRTGHASRKPAPWAAAKQTVKKVPVDRVRAVSMPLVRRQWGWPDPHRRPCFQLQQG